MDSSEQTVQRQLPAIHSFISENYTNVDWEAISQNMAKLEWLNETPTSIGDIITSVWEMIDCTAVASLAESEEFSILSLNSVILYLKNLTYQLNNSNDEARAICYSCKKSASSLQFFQQSSIMLREAQEEELVSMFASIDRIYLELRATVSQVFSELEKVYYYEMYKSLKKALDDFYYTQVLVYQKIRLSYYPKARELLQRYESKSYISSTTYSKNEFFAPVIAGVINGYGRASYHNGDAYEGNFQHSKRHGKGVYFWKDGSRYEGDFDDDKMSGKGVRYYAKGNVYEGDFLEGKKHGIGRMTFSNGDKYVGHWEYDDMSGQGTYTWATGDSFSGRFERDERVGKGTLVLSTGEVYEAKWSGGRMIDNFQ
mmetsp:Transcript_33513/g.58702  ORF Transcript_33513/g.58702 Transcript_33513/m.58702 type:complete len:370 (+) Transcript_33513:292-1401(+)